MLLTTIIAPAALLLALLAAGQNDATAADQEIDTFLNVLSNGKLAEAEAMLLQEPTYREEDTNKAAALPKRAFLEWLGHCRPGIYMNVEFKAPDGSVGRAFHLECQKRGSSADTPYSEKIAFFVNSKGKGIEIQ